MKSFITSAEAAKRLAVSVATLPRWRSDKKGPPAYRFGKVWKYDEAELTDYIQSCRVSSSDEPHP